MKFIKLLGLGTLFAASLFLIPNVFADDAIQHLITTSGNGEVTVQPDSVEVSVAVETQAKTVAEAREQNARKMTAIRQQVQALNIPHLKLQTTNFSVNPVTRYQNDLPDGTPRSPIITGYQISNTLSVKVEGLPSDELGEDSSKILDTALEAGANQSNGLNFYLSKDNPSQQEALKLAVKQAKQIAETMADAAGLHITGVASMESSSYARPMRFAMPMASMMAKSNAAMSPTPVEPGEQTVSSSVTMRFTFAP